MKKISILGATGSIGTQTLDVIRKSENDLKLIGVTANTSVKKVIEIIEEFNENRSLGVAGFYTRKGGPLTDAVLSKWVKEMGFRK